MREYLLFSIYVVPAFEWAPIIVRQFLMIETLQRAPDAIR